MTQHREAPAYQEYAASMMARTDYRLLNMEARGVLYTMRLECWVNGSLPCMPALLARVLGCPIDQIERALPELGAFFVEDAESLRCPELDDYRAHLQDRRDKQAAGGLAGAAKTNMARTGLPVPRATGKATGRSRVSRESLVKPSPEQPSKTKRSQREASNADPWMNDYDRVSIG